MSRILRRPMFRGGPVDSYGTGIASGLADGGRVNYAGGGQIGGGTIYGTPMADGRYGFKKPVRFNTSAGPELTTGEELLELNVAPLLGVEQVETEQDNAQALAGDIKGVSTDTKDTKNTTDEYITKKIGRNKSEVVVKNPDYKPPTKIVKRKSPKTGEETSQVVELTDAEILADRQKALGKGPLYAAKDIVDTNVIEQVTETAEKSEPLEISVEDQITQQAEIFDKLFSKNMEAKNKERLKKARIQDISDVGLDIFARSTKPGADVKTMLGEAAERMVDKPSRTEVLQAKIDDQGDKRYQTSVALAINDYIAGKRSKEATEKLLATKGIDLANALKTIDYKTDLTRILPTDDWQDALRKVSEVTKESATKNSTIKTALQQLFKKKVFTENISLEEIQKNNGKDLEVGFTIVSTDKGKFIIEKFSDGSIKARTDLLI
tara:strand:+ start:824 stop:2131 length:1308 start_codon:yes stop_codon:yes gene_type:complete